MAYCKHHLKKEQKINELEGEIVSLEAQLHFSGVEQRTAFSARLYHLGSFQ